MTALKPMPAHDLKQRLDCGDAILIDVREGDEHAREHIIGARLAPLSAIGAHDFVADRGKIAVFHCKSGMRTQANAAQLLGCGFAEAFYLDGGIEAWKQAGLPVRANRMAPLEIMRRVQMIAGGAVLLGIALGWFVHPGFFALAAFFGAGLLFAGATGWCGMAMLLRHAPWNRSGLSPA